MSYQAMSYQVLYYLLAKQYLVSARRPLDVKHRLLVYVVEDIDCLMFVSNKDMKTMSGS